MSERIYRKGQAQQKTVTGASRSRNLLQRKCACGGAAGVDGLCAKCRDEQFTWHGSRGGFEAAAMQTATQSDSSTQGSVPSPDSVADTGSRLGHDFSRIPIHSMQASMPQTKLQVNQPGDVYEQEADQVATQVMRMADPKSPDDEDETKNTLMRKQGAEPAASTTEGSADVAPVVHDVLNSSGGQSLDTTTRAFMEPRFGHDFSRVRVHSDERAAESAQAVNALAYTVGHDIVFGTGQYAPQSSAGQRLLAHELTHVVQQQSTPGALQGKLKIGNPSDSDELAADAVAHAVTAPESSPYHSSALQIRHQLRSSSLPYPIIQRAVKTWGGEYDTDKYELTKDPGMDGVDIELRFKPNKYVDAELIGMTQAVRSTEKGVPFAIGTGEQKKTLESRMIPSTEAGAGYRIDRLSSERTPLYGTQTPAKGDSLAGGTPTSTTQHGYRYTDKAGKLKEQDAWLHDTPELVSTRKESSQVFETTALAVKGVQEGTFYGSVQWGWRKDAAGKVEKLPLTLVSNDVPSAIFARASEMWNKTKTSKGEETIDLPIVAGKYTNTEGVWLVSNPSHYKTTIIAKLKKDTRLEVTDKGTAKPFNKTEDKYKWWKVTIVDGTHIGKVGWVMQADLSDTKTK